MNEIQDIINDIGNIDCNDVNARERIRLLWLKLFLKEKELSKIDKRILWLQFDNSIMKKRVFNWDLNSLFSINIPIFSDIVNEVYNELFERGFIEYTNLNPCLNLCKYAAIMVYQICKSLGIKVMIIHTKNLGLQLVPHFFAVAIFNGNAYVIDPTFRQFLIVPRFIPEVIYHFKENFMSPASFGNEDFFMDLGINGFFRATEENWAIYLNGFIRANDTAKLLDTAELKLIREKKIDLDYYFERLETECRKFSIERYAPHLA
ncbi:MAG: hypothetical protein HFI49_00485 [Bacilli bacterium]|nr:hypothetical protein [Bacilli bacterium]